MTCPRRLVLTSASDFKTTEPRSIPPLCEGASPLVLRRRVQGETTFHRFQSDFFDQFLPFFSLLLCTEFGDIQPRRSVAVAVLKPKSRNALVDRPE